MTPAPPLVAIGTFATGDRGARGEWDDCRQRERSGQRGRSPIVLPDHFCDNSVQTATLRIDLVTRGL